MKLADRLPPCPFCDSTNVGAQQDPHGMGAGYWAVFCQNWECAATGPVRKTREETEEAWRASDR